VSYLRPYQDGAIEAFNSRITLGQENRLAVELATGLGKTVTGSALAAGWGSALVLTHTEEITGQWVKKLRFAAHGSGLTVGVVKGTSNEPTADLVVASVPTVGNNPERMAAIGRRSLTIADECHHAVAPSWTNALQRAGAWEGVPTLGLTATLARSDGAGLGKVWEDLVFSRGITWAIRQGYLLDIVPYRVRVPEVNSARTDEALDAMLADSIAPEAVVKAWMEHAWAPLPGADGPLRHFKPSTVLFAPLVKSAQAFADAFNGAGIRAAVIHGGSQDREEILAAYERGDITVLCNAMVLTEGWDSPRTMCVIWARKAGGPLFVQGVGRGLRPWLDSPEAPPRELQRCILICVTDTADASLNVVADLSDRALDEGAPGQSLLDMEDEYDLAAGILEEEARHYRGPVRVEEWDLHVQASSKAWKFTRGGAPFLPTAKRNAGYVFVVGSVVYAYGPHPKNKNRMGVRRLVTAPDSSLAMSVAEDHAQELGGDIGALLADRNRPWRKQVPSVEAVQTALRAGVTQAQVDKILGQRAAGKAGKLSDLTDTVLASRVLDPMVNKILERA
jgi:superfamily II DNA or RNA helicase